MPSPASIAGPDASATRFPFTARIREDSDRRTSARCRNCRRQTAGEIRRSMFGDNRIAGRTVSHAGYRRRGDRSGRGRRRGRARACTTHGIPSSCWRRASASAGGPGRIAYGDLALDLGCGWLHSADENDWARSRRRSALRSTSCRRRGSGRRIGRIFRAAEQRGLSRGVGALLCAHRRGRSASSDAAHVGLLRAGRALERPARRDGDLHQRRRGRPARRARIRASITTPASTGASREAMAR